MPFNVDPQLIENDEVRITTNDNNRFVLEHKVSGHTIEMDDAGTIYAESLSADDMDIGDGQSISNETQSQNAHTFNTVTLSDNESAKVISAITAGLIVVTSNNDQIHGAVSAFFSGEWLTEERWDVADDISTTAGQEGSVNIFVDSGPDIIIENKTGSLLIFQIHHFG